MVARKNIQVNSLANSKTSEVHLELDALVPTLAESTTFSAYGEIIRADTPDKKRYIRGAFREGNAPLSYQMSINRIAACLDDRVQVNTMERHPYSEQIFLPLTPGDYLTVVGLPDRVGQIAPDTVRSFILPRFSGLMYHPGTWHYAFTAIREAGDVVVILGCCSNGHDTEYISLAKILDVDLSQYRRNQ